MPHIHDLIDFSVDIFVVHDKKVLLIFHRKHNMWLQIGGHIELNEAVKFYAKRALEMTL